MAQAVGLDAGSCLHHHVSVTVHGGLGEPAQITRADFQAHESRLTILETRFDEYRSSHTKEHTEHVATHAWAYRGVLALAGFATLVGAGLGSAIIRALFGGG